MFYRRNLCAVATLVTLAVASTSTADAPLGGPSVVDACAALDLRDCSVQNLHLDGLGTGRDGIWNSSLRDVTDSGRSGRTATAAAAIRCSCRLRAASLWSRRPAC